MISAASLFFSILTLFIYIFFGFCLKRLNIATGDFAAQLSRFVLYAGQICMLIYGYLRPRDALVTQGIFQMFFLAVIAHVGAYFLGKLIYRKAPDTIRDILIFGTMFSNAGYMGIPIINTVLGPQYVIYATIYIGVFNLFSFSLGRLIYTHDRQYVSVKKMLLNPGVIPVCIGLLLYFTGIGGWFNGLVGTAGIVGGIAGVIDDAFSALTNTVAPLSMVVIGARLAEMDLRSAFLDKYLYIHLFARLLLTPVLLWLIILPFRAIGMIETSVIAVGLVLAATPTAAATTIFAELYDRDSVYAGKLVSISTLLSAFTIPFVALLLNF